MECAGKARNMHALSHYGYVCLRSVLDERAKMGSLGLNHTISLSLLVCARKYVCFNS